MDRKILSSLKTFDMLPAMNKTILPTKKFFERNTFRNDRLNTICVKRTIPTPPTPSGCERAFKKGLFVFPRVLIASLK
jgi:hypothetical protein